MSYSVTCHNFHCESCCPGKLALALNKKPEEFARNLRQDYELAVDSKRLGIPLTHAENDEMLITLYTEVVANLKQGSKTLDSKVPLTSYIQRKLGHHHLRIFHTKKQECTPDGTTMYTYEVEFVGLD